MHVYVYMCIHFNSCILPPFVVFWASDRQFMHLQKVLEWGDFEKGNVFHIDGMDVRIEVVSRPSLPRFDVKTCGSC